MCTHSKTVFFYVSTKTANLAIIIKKRYDNFMMPLIHEFTKILRCKYAVMIPSVSVSEERKKTTPFDIFCPCMRLK
jgi:hypothetical protein